MKPVGEAIMPNAVKVAISLPPTVLDSVEKERRKRGESRSEFFRQAVQAFLRDLQQRKDVERYIQGYLEHPERAEEVDAIRSVSYAALAEEPWD
jgi:metal-responsive CopG/Arc/MetJ family transcriptional regulator